MTDERIEALEKENHKLKLLEYTEIRCLVPVVDKYLIPIDLKEYMKSFGASEFEKRLLEETGNEEADQQETLSVS